MSYGGLAAGAAMSSWTVGTAVLSRRGRQGAGKELVRRRRRRRQPVELTAHPVEQLHAGARGLERQRDDAEDRLGAGAREAGVGQERDRLVAMSGVARP